MTYIARQDRYDILGNHAAITAREAGGDAMEAALAQIAASFGTAARINSLKLRVERALDPARWPTFRPRYGFRLGRIAPLSIEAAIAVVETWRREEQKMLAIAMALGGGQFLSIEVLGELRIALRLARVHFGGDATVACAIRCALEG